MSATSCRLRNMSRWTKETYSRAKETYIQQKKPDHIEWVQRDVLPPTQHVAMNKRDLFTRERDLYTAKAKETYKQQKRPDHLERVRRLTAYTTCRSELMKRDLFTHKRDLYIQQKRPDLLERVRRLARLRAFHIAVFACVVPRVCVPAHWVCIA